MVSYYEVYELLRDEKNSRELSDILSFWEMDCLTPDIMNEKLQRLERLKEIGEIEIYNYCRPIITHDVEQYFRHQKSR